MAEELAQFSGLSTDAIEAGILLEPTDGIPRQIEAASSATEKLQGSSQPLIVMDSICAHYHYQLMGTPSKFLASTSRELLGKLEKVIEALWRAGNETGAPVLITTWSASKVASSMREHELKQLEEQVQRGVMRRGLTYISSLERGAITFGRLQGPLLAQGTHVTVKLTQASEKKVVDMVVNVLNSKLQSSHYRLIHHPDSETIELRVGHVQLPLKIKDVKYQHTSSATGAVVHLSHPSLETRRRSLKLFYDDKRADLWIGYEPRYYHRVTDIMVDSTLERIGFRYRHSPERVYTSWFKITPDETRATPIVLTFPKFDENIHKEFLVACEKRNFHDMGIITNRIMAYIINSLGFKVVSFDSEGALWGPDIHAIDKRGRKVIIEVKSSLGDLDANLIDVLLKKATKQISAKYFSESEGLIWNPDYYRWSPSEYKFAVVKDRADYAISAGIGVSGDGLTRYKLVVLYPEKIEVSLLDNKDIRRERLVLVPKGLEQ